MEDMSIVEEGRYLYCVIVSPAVERERSFGEAVRDISGRHESVLTFEKTVPLPVQLALAGIALAPLEARVARASVGAHLKNPRTVGIIDSGRGREFSPALYPTPRGGSRARTSSSGPGSSH